jgi:hypothetical protein
MTTKTSRINPINTAAVTHEWGVVDAKGRVIGLRIDTREVDFVEVADGGCYYRVAPGHYFSAKMQTTKDGKAYGATQPEHYFATAEERATAIVKRLSAAMKKTGAI